MSSADVPLRILFERLRGDYNAMVGVILPQLQALLGGTTITVTLDQLRTASSTVFPQSSAIVLGDVNGDVGLFTVDYADLVSIDDGYEIIVDASGRRWVRQKGLT